MPSPKVQFQTDYFYHVYNRGVDKRQIFYDKLDYLRFSEGLREFNRYEPIYSLYYQKRYKMEAGFRNPYAVSKTTTPDRPLVSIAAYCLLFNHYHLLLEQIVDSGISKFMRRIGVGYANYFNNRYKRSGTLFQGNFNPKEAKSTEYLSKLSVYVNCNAEIHGVAKKEDWVWSSYSDYVIDHNADRDTDNINLNINKESILSEFQGLDEYIKFCEDLISEIKKNKELKRYDLEL